MHFERIMKPFTKCDKIISYIKKNLFREYSKKNNVYPLLKERTPTAIRNAKWLMQRNQNDLDRGVKLFDLCAYTDIHVLVEKLLYPSKIQ